MMPPVDEVSQVHHIPASSCCVVLASPSRSRLSLVKSLRLTGLFPRPSRLRCAVPRPRHGPTAPLPPWIQRVTIGNDPYPTLGKRPRHSCDPSSLGGASHRALPSGGAPPDDLIL